MSAVRELRQLILIMGQRCFVSSVWRSFGQLITGQQRSRLRPKGQVVRTLKPNLVGI